MNDKISNNNFINLIHIKDYRKIFQCQSKDIQLQKKGQDKGTATLILLGKCKEIKDLLFIK